ncbi:MAG: glycosyltransferase family 2 protein [Elusimicrobiota bacterium]
MNKIDVSIVIGRNEELILQCLESIYKTYKWPIEIFVTSNLSSQEILKKIKIQFPEVHIIINKEKKGFAANHNHIIKITGGEYILILNDDTVLLDKAIEQLINYLDIHPDVAVISPKLLNPDFSLQQSTYSFPSLFTVFLNLTGVRKLIPFNNFTYKLVSLFYKKGASRFWKHDKICKIDTVKGACVLVRRKAIQEVGLMDEVSLAYGEETEWHYRFKKKGWKIIFYPAVKVIHYGKQTTENQPSLIKEEVKGILNFFRKHKSHLSYLIVKGMILVISFFRCLFYLIFLQRKMFDIYFEVIKIVFNS